MENKDQWLNWAIELQGLAQAGLTYGKDVFDLERYTRIREIAAEILSMKSEIPVETVKNLFCNETGYQTPKLDTRAAIIENDRILLVREQNGKWSLPGGWSMWINPLEKTLLKRFWKKPDCALQQTVSLPYRTETGTICRVTPITSAKFSFYARLQAVNFKPTPKRPKADGMRKMNCRSLRRKRTTQSKFKCALQLPAIQTGTFFLIKKTAIQEFLLA